MPITLDHQLRERPAHGDSDFPISLYRDELAQLPGWSGPPHWHPEFEIATALEATLDYRVGGEHLLLRPGDSVFVNGNVLHAIRQLDGERPDPMPNVVFSGALVAAEDSAIHARYIRPVLACSTLPCVLFRRDDPACADVRGAIGEIYACLADRRPCYELTVQRDLGAVFAHIARHFDALPRVEATRVQISTQVRAQKMLSFIYANYVRDIDLEDIARSASVSRSEAGRCFQACMGCSPVEALIRYRLQAAHALLQDSSKSLLEVSLACGFHSVNYFTRQFRRHYGYTPRRARGLGKSC